MSFLQVCRQLVCTQTIAIMLQNSSVSARMCSKGNSTFYSEAKRKNRAFRKKMWLLDKVKDSNAGGRTTNHLNSRPERPLTLA